MALENTLIQEKLTQKFGNSVTNFATMRDIFTL
jgi:hypothetical protein